MIEQVLDPIDPKQLAPAIESNMNIFSENGFTSLKLAEAEVPWVKSLNLLDEQGKLTVRMFPSWLHRSHMAAMSADESRAISRWVVASRISRLPLTTTKPKWIVLVQ